MNSARGEHDNPAPTRPSTGWAWLSAAWAVALVSTFAALFIGEVMGMAPCQLCWYQRILMFPLAVILGMAAFGNDRRGAIYAMP
ncbi:MAG: disulfide bond formation protein B, partial [Rubrivivax sp.]|nr:disulfide bond formation protein B [Rubrivivax sp.]